MPDDPLELARLSLKALDEKFQLISGVRDLETAQAVADRFPAVASQERKLDEKLRNRLVPSEVQQQIDEQFTPRRRELNTAWSREYLRVAFIPGAWEHMHPELTSVADMTVFPEDAEGLEREAVRLLNQAMELLRQVTDVSKALELSPRYRVASGRISPVLSRLNVARGGSGARENHSQQIRDLRRQFDQERKRLGTISGAYHALQHGERRETGTATTAASSNGPQQILTELRSQDVPRMRNALQKLEGAQPGPGSEAISQELIALLEVEQLRHSAAEVLKRDWLRRDQIPEIREAMSRIDDRGLRYNLAEAIGRVSNLDRENIEFLATLFHESPGDAVRVLRNVGPAAEPVAHAYASDPSVEVRQTVCELLRDIGTSTSLPVLEKMLTDSHRGVVDKAREAIREIGKPIDQRPHLRDRRKI